MHLLNILMEFLQGLAQIFRVLNKVNRIVDNEFNKPFRQANVGFMNFMHNQNMVLKSSVDEAEQNLEKHS